jgi:hypothetical protein
MEPVISWLLAGDPAHSLAGASRSHWRCGLRALDYFQDVDAPRDRRLAEATGIVRAGRGKDGRWLLPAGYSGKTFFQLERVGAPSRWHTLRALRVLEWWEGGR